MAHIFVLLVLTLHYFQDTHGSTSTAIPDLLLNCYRSNYTETFPQPPLTVQLLVEIIRKIELSEGSFLNLRMLTTSTLHAVRLDGIRRSSLAIENESVTPYRATGNQFYKYKLIVDYLTPGESALFPSDSLTTSELCLLHEMISSTVDSRERGDERRTCVETKMPEGKDFLTFRNTGVSLCPVEKGVVRTKWGTVSPGHVLAAVASALERNQETVSTISQAINRSKVDENAAYTFTNSSRKISNTWISTVAGDLGEVVVYQASTTPEVGNVGYWNDSFYPRVHYLIGEKMDLTDSELLGGIDGIVIASQVQSWLNILSRTRISQLIDMYYSSRGIQYDESFKACNRHEKFSTLLHSTNLTDQVIGAAQLLQDLSNSPELIFEEGIRKFSEAAVETFKAVAENKCLPHADCVYEDYDVQNLEIIVVLGRNFDAYTTKQFVSELIEQADISFYGNKLGFVNGQNGRLLTNVTGEIMQLYTDLNNVENTWPSRISLSQGLIGANVYYMNKESSVCNGTKTRPTGQVILVLASSDRITDSDFSQSVLSVRSIKRFCPDTRIIYVTSEVNFPIYENLLGDYGNDYIVNSTGDAISIVNQVSDILRNVPGRILNFYCEDSQTHLEDYVTPNVTKVYEIHETYLQRANFNVKFKGNDYSDLTICAYTKNSKTNRTCEKITGNGEVNFNTRDYCPDCSVLFSIDADNTKFKCSEPDCRYPGQARLNIHTSWTRSGSITSTSRNILQV